MDSRTDEQSTGGLCGCGCTRGSATALLWLHSVDQAWQGTAGQSRTKGAKAKARHARPLAVVRLDCRRWRRMCVCPWLFSCCRPQKTVRHPHGVDWCTQGRYLPTCANVTERWSVNVTAVHHSTLPYEEETVRAGQRQEGGTGDSKSSPGRQGQMQLPQGSRQAPTPWVQGP